MKRLLLLTLILFATISYGQEFQFQSVGNLADFGGQIKAQVSPDDLARVKGEVVDEKGKPIPHANILLCGSALFFDGTTKKSGSYSVGCRYGTYTAVAIAPGYKKQSLDITLDQGDVKTLNFKLSPIGDEILKGEKGDVVQGNWGSYSISYNSKHSAYNTLSLYDLICNLPCVEPTDKGFLFKGEGVMTLYVNGKEARVPIQSLKGYFSSVKAEQVKAVKVLSGNEFQKVAPSIFISFSDK